MADAPLFLCADIGGTFTDCLATWVDDGVRRNACRKVLSTGLIRCGVSELESDQKLRVEIPAELLGGGGLEGASQASVLCDDFFRSASLNVLVEGVRQFVGKIDAFDSRSSTIHLSDSDPETFRLLDRVGIAEIDCHLEAPVLATHLMVGIPIDQPLPELVARIGTTRGTNALLTRSGANTALVATQGFGDILWIGEQDRPELFDLSFAKEPPLAESVMEVAARMDAQGDVLVQPNEQEIIRGLETLLDAGIETLAICLMHAHLNPEHELLIERLAKEAGFREVSRSSEVSPLIKLVARAETTALDAYLNPILSAYVRRIRRQLGSDRCELQLMTSGGNLVQYDRFRGRDSVLSGPAGGVVGLKYVAQSHGSDLAIGLDMGGTSTDVSRFDGQVGRRYETHVAGLRVMTPMMDIHTVAAGGGSICDYVGGRLVVGPSSAGASPGPACYGGGGPLTVTDVNVLLGRLSIDRFPFPLDVSASRERLHHVASKMDSATQIGTDLAEEVLAEGFLEIAVTHMAEAVRAITTARGVDVRDHALVGFGGAAAQHICRVADALGITRIIEHPRSSVLSAVGMGVAAPGLIETVGVYKRLQDLTETELRGIEKGLVDRTIASLDIDDLTQIDIRLEYDCRYVGTDSPIAVQMESVASLDSLRQVFDAEHEQRFGYQRSHHDVELVSLRCEIKGSMPEWAGAMVGSQTQSDAIESASTGTTAQRSGTAQVFCHGQWDEFSRYDRERLSPGDRVPPKSMVVSDQSTLMIEPNWQGEVASDGTILLEHCRESTTGVVRQAEDAAGDAIQMEIVARRLQSIADAMGEVLRRTAVSVNVKERLDFSCAVFRGDGTLIANAPHVPVHLGAMGHTVRALAETFPEMVDGDCYVSNDPYAGGSHLPDVTVVTPVFCEESAAGSSPTFYVASRAHHAEIGGITPGSMPPMATSLAQEGVLIRGIALVRQGVSNESALREILSSGPYPSRNVNENLADLRAQVAAGREGARMLCQMTREFSLPHVHRMMDRLLDVAAESVENWICNLPTQPMSFRDTLDDGTVIAVTMTRGNNRLEIDFSGTSGVHPNGFNATESIVNSAVLYVMKCFCDANLPLCDGVMRPIDLRLPEGLLSPPRHDDPSQCAAVVAGNVETSQRIVDVLLGAIGSTESTEPVFRSVAASQGTMNNVLIGDDSFGYYETIGGGAGATVFGSGADGVHTHMTNTRITDPEVLESRLPMRLVQFSIRQGSGGVGKLRGGNGLVREFEFLRPLTVSLITGRRTTQPYGVCGGKPGASGVNRLIPANAKEQVLPACTTIEVSKGDRLQIETPGGGGWGGAKPYDAPRASE